MAQALDPLKREKQDPASLSAAGTKLAESNSESSSGVTDDSKVGNSTKAKNSSPKRLEVTSATTTQNGSIGTGAPEIPKAHHSYDYYHSYRGVHSSSTIPYDRSRAVPAPGIDPSVAGRTLPPPGPYTTAQYDARNGPLSRSMAHHPGGAAMPPASPHMARQPPPTIPTSISPSPKAPNNVTREPQPPTHHYHHPAMHGEHHRIAGFPPFRDKHLTGPPHPHRHSWTNQEYGAPPPRYYEAAPTSNGVTRSLSYPPQPPPPSSAYSPSNRTETAQSNANVGSRQQLPAMGPYRYSDPTLRRDALTTKYKVNNGGTPIGDIPSDVDGREGATSPTQIESSHREEVSTMGCTCKKTKCLKLYCQCFAVQIFCGPNCRCMGCHNTAEHEKDRQEAMRIILSRNPQAFDTKFKKGTQPDTVRPELSHKLGCKCRKSACMKKYCECYAGNVKCTASCRCVGCKNMPQGGFGGGTGAGNPSAIPLAVMAPTIRSAEATQNHNGAALLAAAIESTSVASAPLEPPQAIRKHREPYMMNAAHNLVSSSQRYKNVFGVFFRIVALTFSLSFKQAFLKHASPAVDRSNKESRRTPTHDGDLGSMPSLAPEESPVENSESDGTTKVVSQGSSVISNPNTAEKTAVNALLMAAMAMTEMSSSQAAGSTTPPRTKSSSTAGNIRPNLENQENFETPQKNLMKQFQSPKRKQWEAIDSQDPSASLGRMRSEVPNGDSSSESSPEKSASDGADDSPKREHPETAGITPSVQHKIKRSRIGSQRKGPRKNLDLEMEVDQTVPMVTETPQAAKTGARDELTPVSARCLDFKRMTVHGTPEPRAMKDSPAAAKL